MPRAKKVNSEYKQYKCSDCLFLTTHEVTLNSLTMGIRQHTYSYKYTCMICKKERIITVRRLK